MQRTRAWQAKLNAANRGLKRSAETLEKMRAAHLGKRHTKAHREKIRQSCKAAYADKKLRARLSRLQTHYMEKHGGYHQKNPTEPELAFGKLVDRRSWKYIGCFPKNGSNDHNKIYAVSGFTADFVNHARKILVWLDGCHWHGCPTHSNGHHACRQSVDREMVRRAKASGWKAIRFWEHEVRDNPQQILKLLSKL